jgi:hypothetical protein
MKFCGFASQLFLLLTSAVILWGQSNPIPTVDGPVSPQAVLPGSVAFTLTVRGANFVPGAAVNWNGAARSTTFVSGGELQALIPASDVAAQGSALITVTNPSPGGGLSSSSFGVMEIHQPISSILLTKPTGYAGYGGVLYTADLNGDNKLDMVQLGFGVTVLLGTGDGTFTKSASFPAPNNPLGLCFGDFNGDGKTDFAFAMNSNGLIFVALGDGTGKFHFLPGFRSSFKNPGQTAAGDFNRDGKLDLAVADGNGVSVLLGNGDGTFQAPQTVLSLVYGSALIAADLNGDGVLDLAFFGSDTISVVLGNGDGTFQPPIETPVPVYLQPWVSDFNEDGKLDFLILTIGDPERIGIVLGNGDGTFQQPQKYYSTGFYPQAVLLMVGDFNSDGNSDVFGYGELGDLAGFLAGNGDGTFRRVSNFTMPGPMRKGYTTVGDFNSDGLLDFAVAAQVGAQVYLQAPQ